MDRDGRSDEERAKLIAKIQEDGKTKCFVTEKNDIENYFCSVEHLKAILDDLGKEYVADEVEDIVSSCHESSIEESRNSLLNRKINSAQAADRGAIAHETEEFFKANTSVCINGHILIGKIKSEIHARWHLSEADLIKNTVALKDETLSSIKNHG